MSDPELATDPVCGMQVDPNAGKPRHDWNGQTFHFCGERCRTRFAADPPGFLAPKVEPPPAPPGTIFTCPMHPQIRQEGPGSCPICGMALEPETVSLDDAPNAELADMTRRFWIAAALTAPV